MTNQDPTPDESMPSRPEGLGTIPSVTEAIERAVDGVDPEAAAIERATGVRADAPDEADIEHYHRIRNKLHHDGTGLSVDEQYLLAYHQIAVLLLKNLFGVALGDPKPAPTLERLILLWNKIEESFKQKLKKAEIGRAHV